MLVVGERELTLLLPEMVEAVVPVTELKELV